MRMRTVHQRVGQVIPHWTPRSRPERVEDLLILSFSPLIAFPFRCVLATRISPPYPPSSTSSCSCLACLPLSDGSPTFSWPSLGEGGREGEWERER